jgi:hypothetical protein
MVIEKRQKDWSEKEYEMLHKYTTLKLYTKFHCWYYVFDL